MTRGLDNDRQTYFDMPLEHLHCYGCAHSAASVPWPGQPSGERPCGFCVRNKFRHLNKETDDPRWYDGSRPVSNPMDCYQPLDMSEQVQLWMRDAETSGAEALNRLIELRSKIKDTG